MCSRNAGQLTAGLEHPQFLFGGRRLVALLLLLALGLFGGRANAADDNSPIGRRIDNFELPDSLGALHTLEQYHDRSLVVVAFVGVECPIARLYAPRLEQIARDYADRGVTVLAIDSNRQDSLTDLQGYVNRHGISFPVLRDSGNRIADQFGALRTIETYVLDQQRTIRYHGRIDDQYGVGYSRSEPTRNDLREALDELLTDQPVSVPQTKVVGCFIGRVRKPQADASVTYSRDVASVLNRHCVECHREGEIAPFALSSFDDAVGWGETIAEVIREQRMPPWHANPAHGEFANSRLMSDEEKQTIYDWVEAGMPEGDPAVLPSLPQFVEGWQLPRRPDQVVAMRSKPFDVPAEGTIEYQYFAVDPGFTEDRWIAGAEVVPGNRNVVHHAIVFFSPPNGRGPQGLGWISAYVPGFRPPEPVTGLARRVPAGSKLIFQMHYTPNGSPQQDVTKIGLLFADPETVTEELVTQVAVDPKFEIPPHAEEYRISTTRRHWPKGSRLLALTPHMHLRGRSFRFVGHFPDGRDEILLDVPHYDFNWQHTYQLAEPLNLPEGFSIECIATYDNSGNNPVNPDPSAAVTWGDQSWEEMMIAFFEVAIPRGSLVAKQRSRTVSAEVRGKAEKAADEMFRRFDLDGDGRIARGEVPPAFGAFGFGRFDANGDRWLTREEVLQEALRSIDR
ncbi:Thiol-disulfide oxidoreductase ResA [Maioricimonas rarisocia]|uniref:Thiol-disulfide oxidoreductase ResA n=1 Tax=Maioricimonas rarisocia TaxID=2528026 RepID=A0A517Z807_9PLAN|nr:redoxin domain-containing protein [Maioricimonas rarisocia]QDU38606.1 Thiol-disulfide oxidoreductase ResA [Maioricimonas rarisocia]